MIGAVGHDDGIVRANREASRPGKASGFAPPHPELVQLPPLQQVVTPPAIAVEISTTVKFPFYQFSISRHPFFFRTERNLRKQQSSKFSGEFKSRYGVDKLCMVQIDK